MLNLIDAHQGDDHVTSDDARQFQAATFGAARAVISGMEVTKSGNNTLSVSDGFAWLDGARFRVEGPETIAVPQGAIGKRRRDVLYIAYELAADGTESVSWQYQTGELSSAPAAQSNPHAGSILDGDTVVWAPFATVDLNGLTVGEPTRLMGQWVWPPSNTDMAQTVASLQKAAVDARSEALAAKEAAREALRAASAVTDVEKAVALLDERLSVLDARQDHTGSIVAALLGTWFVSNGAIYAPGGSGSFDPADGSVRLEGAAWDAKGQAVVLDSARAATFGGTYTTKQMQALFQSAATVARKGAAESEGR